MASKILLADDSVTIQKVVELTFSDRDYEVTCVGDGAQVLDQVRALRPDIVLLDVILPGENGYDVCDAIKKDPTLASIPVLLLTGTFEPFDRRRAETVGADGHLTKPFESQVLISRVSELLQKARRSRVSAGGSAAGIINAGEEYVIRPSAPAAPGPAPAPPRVLSDADVDRIARRLAEHLGERVVREVAWDVVPDLAERIVRQRLRQIEEEPE
jgi:CheY-like chemotaxis protein